MVDQSTDKPFGTGHRCNFIILNLFSGYRHNFHNFKQILR